MTDNIWTEYERQVREEEELAWQEHRAELERLDREAYDDEVCPCWHTRDKHYLGDGDCQVRHCGCPGFGVDPSEWEEQPRGTNVGGDKGGFMIYDS